MAFFCLVWEKHKIDQVINYYCLSFLQSKIVKAKNIAGSCRPIKISQTVESSVPLVFVTMRHKDTEFTLRELLDSGDGASVTTNNDQVNWITIDGKFSTRGTISKQFKLSELSLSTIINYTLHVTQSLGLYDIIIGRDLLKSLGLIMDLS